MGQLLSRQAAPARHQLHRNQSASQGQNLRSEQPLCNAPSDAAGTALKSGRRNDRNLSRTPTTSSAQGNRSHSHPFKVIDGNIGTPRRQQKYVRGKAPKKHSNSTTHDHQRRRKDDIEPSSRARDTGSHKLRSHPSNPGQYHEKSRLGKECIICTDIRSQHRFPARPPTAQCTHDTDVCRRCLRTWIQSEFSTKIWNEINCPVCFARMQYDDIRKFAPKEVFRR
jgi:hypothetical protein